MSSAGDKDAGAIINAWNQEASKHQQLAGGKEETLKIVLGLMPQMIFGDVVLPAVGALGWGTTGAQGVTMPLPTSASSQAVGRAQAHRLADSA